VLRRQEGITCSLAYFRQFATVGPFRLTEHTVGDKTADVTSGLLGWASGRESGVRKQAIVDARIALIAMTA